MEYLTLLSDETVRQYLKDVGDTVEILSREVDRLRNENNYLKAENYKDSELDDMKKRLENMQEYCKCAFDVPDYKKQALDEWQLKHMTEKHGYGKEGNDKYLSLPVEMNFSYEFTPSTIGVFGTCSCGHCGEKFNISDV